MTKTVLALALLLACLALAGPASASAVGAASLSGSTATCTGVLVGGRFTGSCPNDPACPSPDSVASGIYVHGRLVACI